MTSENERDLIKNVLPFCLPKAVLFKRDSFNWIKRDEETRAKLKRMEEDISEMKKEITELRMMVSSPSAEDDYLVLEEASPVNPLTDEVSPEEAPPEDN